MKKARIRCDQGVQVVQGQDLIDNLPDDLLIYIFSFIPALQHRCCCAAVSKKWLFLQASMSSSGCTCHDFLLPRRPRPSTTVVSRCFKGAAANNVRLAAMAIGICPLRPALTELSIAGAPPSSYPSVSDIGLSLIARASGCRLKSLALVNCCKITCSGIATVASSCIVLEKLELTNAKFVADDGLAFLATRCLSLLQLSLVACPNVSNRSLHAFAKHSTKLKSLTLASCPLITDSSIASLVAYRSSLEALKISSMKLTDIVLRAIAYHGKQIQFLLLDNVCGVSSTGYCWIGLATELKCLVLKACAGLADRSFATVYPFSFAGITKLAIDNCSSLTDRGLLELSMSAKKLECFLLRSCSTFSCRSLMLALRNCSRSLRTLTLIKCNFLGRDQEGNDLPVIAQQSPLLETVKLDECGGIGDDFILWIGESCKRLREVSFVRMDSLTDRGMRCFLDRLRGWNKIARVDLSGCTGLGNRTVWAVTRDCKASLKFLALKGCRRVTDRGVAVIGRRCEKLAELDVGGCDLGDEGVKKLALDEPMDLESISMAGCSRITDRSLVVLKEHMGPGLNRVNVTGCAGVSWEMVNWLKCYIDRVDY